MEKFTPERQHPDVWEVPKKVIRDEIHTDNATYARVLDQLYREHNQIPHEGYMWRITGADSADLSRTEYIGPLANTEPRPVFIPGPTVWIFMLERDAD